MHSRAAYGGEAALFDLAPATSAEGARWRAGDGNWSEAPRRMTLALDAPSPVTQTIHVFADGSTSGSAVLVTAGCWTWRVLSTLADDVTLNDEAAASQ